tara:strand:- start:1463 stop:2044 length:582 start_codon:yes stop_codon:yes gene_type:complete
MAKVLKNNTSKHRRIAHFAEDAERRAGSSEAPVQPNHSELAALYPSPKTADQQRAEDEEREVLHQRKLPKYPFLTIPFFGTFVFIGGLIFAQNILKMWMTGSIGVIFFSFALWLALCGSFVAWARYSNAVLYVLGRMSTLFWAGFGVILVVMSVLFLLRWPVPFESGAFSFVLGAIYLVLLSALTLTVTRLRR